VTAETALPVTGSDYPAVESVTAAGPAGLRPLRAEPACPCRRATLNLRHLEYFHDHARIESGCWTVPWTRAVACCGPTSPVQVSG